MRLIMENFRSFVEYQEHDIRPITLLVGENSSGKSSFLAALSVVTSAQHFPFAPDFNEPPYFLGNYSTIATTLGTDEEAAESFQLGRFKPNSEDKVTALYRNIGGRPICHKVEYALEDGRVTWINVFDDTNPHASVAYVNSMDEEVHYVLPIENGFPVSMQTIPISNNLDSVQLMGLFLILGYISTFVRDGLDRTASFSPIRIDPQRTYDQIFEHFSPDGRDTPFSLNTILSDTRSASTLFQFGVEAGLFDSVEVKQLGDHDGDPRQLVVKLGSNRRNLIDVGYGVSQVLPIVVQGILGSKATTFLLQQPEVHLHPRAQAALGSLFVELAARDKRQFVVETHSDYIVDRVILEVKRGNISPSKVQILYFEREGVASKIHQITVDKRGNLENAPKSYRQFFLQEELKHYETGNAA